VVKVGNRRTVWFGLGRGLRGQTAIPGDEGALDTIVHRCLSDSDAGDINALTRTHSAREAYARMRKRAFRLRLFRVEIDLWHHLG